MRTQLERRGSVPAGVPVWAAARHMIELDCRELEVLSQAGESIGTVRERDLTRFLAGGQNLFDARVGDILGASSEHEGGKLSRQVAPYLEEPTAEQIMSAPPVVCGTEAPIGQVLDLLATCAVSGLPVVDEHTHVVGLISQRDVARVLGGPSPELPLRRGAATGPFLRDGAPKRAGDLMSRPAVVGPDTPMRMLARTMLARAVDQVVVVSGHRPIGIVTRADLLRALVEEEAGEGGDLLSSHTGPPQADDGA